MTSENSGKTNLISCGKNWQEKYQGRIQEPKSRAGGQEREKKKLSVADGQTDRPTDRPTDGQSGLWSRVHATKKQRNKEIRRFKEEKRTKK